MKIISIFIKDPNDNIRVNIIDSLIVLKNHKNPSKFNDFIMTCLTTVIVDESWRIRFTLADKLFEVFILLIFFLVS